MSDKEKDTTVTGAVNAEAEKLQKKLEKLQSDHDKLKKQHDDLGKAHDELKGEKAKLEEDLDESLKTVGDLSAQLDTQAKNRGSLTISHDKKEYKVVGKSFNIPGFGKLSADDLVKNKKAISYLLGKKSAVLVEIKG